MQDDEIFPIPAAALGPARQPWRKPEEPGIFESLFDNPKHEDRRTDPSYYNYFHGSTADDLNEFSVFTYSELIGCVEAGIFRSFNKVKPMKVVSINEHALHAYEDFCREVSDAWRKYQSKLDRIPQPHRFKHDEED